MANSTPTPPTPSTQTGSSSALVRGANVLIDGIARHWLVIFSAAAGLYVLLPLLAPLLMEIGWVMPGRVIYAFYSFVCHQLPDHSYFLFGEAGHSHAPSLATLEANGLAPGLGLFQQRSFVGNETLGYKAAICQRDVAIYGSIFLAGLAYGGLRRLSPKGHVPGLSWKYFLLFLIPIGIDGVTQMVGLHESNWWLRSVTGALFGAACVWLAYPYVDEAMDELRATSRSSESNRERLVANSTGGGAQ